MKSLPVYLILFPSSTVQKKGTELILVCFFIIFKAAALPEIKKKNKKKKENELNNYFLTHET